MLPGDEEPMIINRLEHDDERIELPDGPPTLEQDLAAHMSEGTPSLVASSAGPEDMEGDAEEAKGDPEERLRHDSLDDEPMWTRQPDDPFSEEEWADDDDTMWAGFNKHFTELLTIANAWTYQLKDKYTMELRTAIENWTEEVVIMLSGMEGRNVKNVSEQVAFRQMISFTHAKVRRLDQTFDGFRDTMIPLLKQMTKDPQPAPRVRPGLGGDEVLVVDPQASSSGACPGSP